MRKWMITGMILALTACEKQTDWALQKEENFKISVDGMISDENKVQCITLKRISTEPGVIPEPVANALVKVTDGTSTWFFTEKDTLTGIYYTDSAMQGEPGRTYSLQITSNGHDYTASDQMMPVDMLSQLKYAKGSNDLYHITWVANPYNPTKAAMYRIQLDWSQVPGYEMQDSAACTAILYYYTLTTIDVSEIFQPEMEKIYFPAGTKITEKKYSLSPAYEYFIRCMLLETSWRGGLFDGNSANAPTNLSEEAMGFFSACSVASLSLTVTP